MIVVGVDPGKKGGFCILDKQGDDLNVVAGGMYPLIQAKSKEVLDSRKLLDAWAAACGSALPIKSSVCVVENVHSMPKMGAPSVFQFGRMFGCLEACVYEAFDRIEYVEPHRWKAKFNLVGGAANKSVSRDTASRLIGQAAGAKYWPKQKHEGVAEAALMALYYLRFIHK